MDRSPVETATIQVTIFADVQQNPDGTWTAVSRFGTWQSPPQTGSSKEEALNRAAEAASVSVRWDL
jgi:hypothetical protein